MLHPVRWSPSDPLQKISENMIPVATEKYLGGTDDPAKKKDLFLDLIADVIFGVPSVMVSRGHRGEFQVLDGRWSQIYLLGLWPAQRYDMDRYEIC